MNTMNDMDDNTKHQYNRYILEVMQMEWEQAEQLRHVADDDHVHKQVQHTVPEHTGANALLTTASPTMTGGVGGVKPAGRPVSYRTGVNSMGYDEWAGTYLCYRCDSEAEYGGLCEAHYDEYLHEQEQDELEAWDEWVEDAYSAEELERAQREQEEVRDDH